MRSGVELLVGVLATTACVACSVLDNRVELPTCRSHEQCAALVSADPSCLVFRCIDARCAETVIDFDGDGAGIATCVDRYCTDTDGPCASRDCDDTNRAVYPGAPEVCNGVDDDCNGRLDGPGEDDDGDGHADLCAGAAASDCDDTEPTTFARARERCNGIDDDCIVGGITRASGGSVAEPLEDLDGDGHAAPEASCETGMDGEMPKDDCDDTQASVHPGARELCDGLDNDCDGTPDDWNDGVAGSSCFPIDLAVADSHSCVRMVDDTVICWGEAGYRLGATAGLDDGQAQSARVASEEPLLDVATLDDGTCVATASGRVTCWGPSALVTPRLVDWTEDDFGTVDGLEGVSVVVGGDEHACALVARGVACWGRSASGAIDGVPRMRVPVPPTIIAGTEGASDVDTSFYHSCAVVGGRVVCWGDARYGALGGAPAPDALTVTVPGIDDAAEVAVGLYFTCVRHVSGEVSCFGDLRFVPGESCNDCPGHATPRRVVGLDDVVSIDAYTRHVCATRADGSVWCWGRNFHGQLGDGTLEDPRLEPVRAIGVEHATQVEVGAFHTCALTSRGVWCWGRQVQHRLGDGRLAGERSVALPASVLFRPLQLVAARDSTCFRMPDQSLRCSGRIDTRQSCYAMPVATGEPIVDVDVAEGEGHAWCVVVTRVVETGAGRRETRAVRCRGATQRHAFLVGARVDAEVPLAGEPIDVATGEDHACAVDVDGAVSCWGAGGQGQLGASEPLREGCYTTRGDVVPGYEIPCSTTPVHAELDGPAVVLAAGRTHTCALLDDGEVQCWGDNRAGQLGRGSRSSEGGVGYVVGLPPDDPVVSIAAGANASCAVLRTGAAWCWGDVLSLGPVAAAPQPVTALAGVAQIALSRGATDDLGPALCARLTSGPVVCLGTNVEGRLGGYEPPCDSTSCAATNELVESVFEDAIDLACGRAHCCATRRSGQVTCWGSRDAGQRADGSIGDDVVTTRSTVDLVAYGAGVEAPACRSTP